MSEDSTDTRYTLEDSTRDFIRACGGRTKVKDERDGLAFVIQADNCRTLLKWFADSETKARRLCAAALLGLSLASIVAESDARRVEAN